VYDTTWCHVTEHTACRLSVTPVNVYDTTRCHVTEHTACRLSVTPVNVYDTTWCHVTEHTASQLSKSIEVTMAVQTVIATLWGMTPCNFVEKCEHFGFTHFIFSKEV